MNYHNNKIIFKNMKEIKLDKIIFKNMKEIKIDEYRALHEQSLAFLPLRRG